MKGNDNYMIKKIIVNCLYKELEDTKKKEEKLRELIETNERKIEKENEKKLMKKSIKEENKKVNQEKYEDSNNVSNSNLITQIIIKSNGGIENKQIKDILNKYTKVDTDILNTDIEGNYNIKIIEIEGQEEKAQTYQENEGCEDKEDDKKIFLQI